MPDRSPLLHGYRPLPGVYDEAVDAMGQLRPHWQACFAELAQLGPEAMAHGQQMADRHMRDQGVFYRVYDDLDGDERPWPLAALPIILSAADWRTIEVGLCQRAELVERLLADVYGLRHLVREGALPAPVVAASAEYLRPLAGIVPASGHHLDLYAADIGRGPDGRWWVLSDRTQAPSGLGYALENRVALSRAFPSLFRAQPVQRLATFFQGYRDMLSARAQSGPPSVCLLTPGALNETYHEHAYLARYLGFALAMGGDLAVIDDRAYLRTVEGLTPIDVIIRRLDAPFVDPLELNATSWLGTPGLVRAVRAGTLSISNALGAGFAETRALLAFLPRLAQRLLGEPLLLPNIATWWCGQSDARAHVLDRFESMAIAPAFRSASGNLGLILGADLPPEARSHLQTQILARGMDHVGQEIVQLSTTPVWRAGTHGQPPHLVPRPCVLRVFVARTPDGWQVMPGAFCRIAEHADARATSMQRGSRSADVWVVDGQPQSAITLLPRAGEQTVTRMTGPLPARAADNLFWLGRYVERCEAVLRVQRAYALRILEPDWVAGQAKAALVQILCDWQVRAAGKEAIACPNQPRLLARSMRGAASAVRERLSGDAWTTLTELHDVLGTPEALAGDHLETIGRALRLCAAFSGLLSENYVRLGAWRFLDLGRRVERGLNLVSQIKALLGDDAGSLDALLELADCQMSYRQRYVLRPEPRLVVDMLLGDPSNPRSIAFQIRRVRDHLLALSSGENWSLDVGTMGPPPLEQISLIGARLASYTDQSGLDPALLSATHAALVATSDDLTNRIFAGRVRRKLQTVRS